MLLLNLIDPEPLLLDFKTLDLSRNSSTGSVVMLFGEDDFHGDVVGIGANFKDEACFFISSGTIGKSFKLSLEP